MTNIVNMDVNRIFRHFLFRVKESTNNCEVKFKFSKSFGVSRLNIQSRTKGFRILRNLIRTY